MKTTKNNRSAILGILILSIGTVLLLDNFNVLDFPIKQYLFSWKTLLIVIGVALLVSKKNNAGGIILVSLGTIFWIPAIFDYQIALNQIFLPAVLVVVGVILLTNYRNLDRKSFDKVENSEVMEIEPEESH